MARADIDLTQFDHLAEALEQFQGNSERIINSYFQEKGYERIAQSVTRVLPTSGRTWKKKRKAARIAGVSAFRAEFPNLAVITRTITPYNYLYFPDDGSNTIRHYGNQQFMYRGAENAAPEIVDAICTRLVQALEEE